MGFVGNYAPRGLAPQIDDMPVIPKNRRMGYPPASELLQLQSTHSHPNSRVERM